MVTLLKSRQFSEVLTQEAGESATLLFPTVPKAVPKNGSDTESESKELQTQLHRAYLKTEIKYLTHGGDVTADLLFPYPYMG